MFTGKSFSPKITFPKHTMHHFQYNEVNRRAAPPKRSALTSTSSSLSKIQHVIRLFQTSVFFRNDGSIFEDMDMGDGLKWELSLQPPSVDDLQKCLGNVFDSKWVKYMYAHFKNECPTGKMRFSSFKNLLSPHLPVGVSDEYIKRLFFAFSSGRCEVTFQALLETLAMLNSSSATTHAKWTMRLITGSDTKPICYEELANFVRSIFLRSESERRLSKPTSCRLEEKLTLNKVIEKRTKYKFAMLDRNDDGLIEVSDLVDFFEGDGRINLQRLTAPQKQISL